MSSKRLRFYKPVIVNRAGDREELDGGFWSDVHARIEQLDPGDRAATFHLEPYFGEAGIGQAPAHRFFRVGRVRHRADWPDTLDVHGVVSPLDLDDAELFEGAYLVPFGTQNQLAFMGPLRGSIIGITAVEWWFTYVLGMHRTEKAIELTPIMDSNVFTRLGEADGLSKLRIKLPKGFVPEMPSGGGQIEQAIVQAAAAGQDQLDVEIGFSFGHATPRGEVRQTLQRVAGWLGRSSEPDRVEIGMILEDEEDGRHTETVDLMKNRVAVTIELPGGADDTRMATDEVLTAIDNGVREFRRRT